MARAISITNSEISMVFWMISLIMNIITIKLILDLYLQVPLTQFTIILFILPMGLIMSFISMALPNYLVTKHRLNIFIDKITNPDFMGWLRVTASKKLSPQIVKVGSMGVLKGIGAGEKNDIINKGDYTLTLTNGNQVVVKLDMLNTNANLEKCAGWQIYQKHHGFIGFDAWEEAASEGEILFKKDLKTKEEKQDGKVQLPKATG